MLRVPLELHGDVSRHQNDPTGRVFGKDAEPVKIECPEPADERRDDKNRPAFPGNSKCRQDQEHAGQHRGEGAFVHSEPAVDEGKFGFEPVEAEGMEIAHGQKRERFWDGRWKMEDGR